MLSAQERTTRIANIQEFPRLLDAALEKLGTAAVDKPCGEGEWTVRQVVHHVADSHMNGFVRMKLVLAEENPILKPYDQDEWAQQPDMQLPLLPSLSILKGLHERWVVLLRSLPESSWSRTGIHLENGKVTLDDLLVVYANHCAAHLEQIAKVGQ